MGLGRIIGLATAVAVSCLCSATPLAAAPAVQASDPAAMQRLMPGDAVAVVGAPSLAALDQAIAALAQAAQSRIKGASGRLSQLRGWPKTIQLDHSRPLLVAVRPMQGLSWPDPVFILPVTEIPAVNSYAPGSALYIDGDYIGVSQDASYAPGGSASPLADSLPEGHVAARAHLAELLGPLRSAATAMMAVVAASQPSGLEGMGGMDSAALISAYTGLVFDAIEATPLVEAGLTFADGHFTLDGLCSVREGSALADIPPASCDKLDEMVSWLDAGAPMQIVTAMDAGAYAKVLSDWMLDTSGIWPQASEDDLMEYLATMQVLGARCGFVSVGEMDFSEYGMEFAYQFEAEDPNGMVELMSQVMVMGYQLGGGQGTQATSTTEDGWTISETSVDMNASLDRLGLPDTRANAATQEMVRKVYGGDGVMRFSTRASADRVTMVMGGQEPAGVAASRPPASGQAPEQIAFALQRVDGAHTRMAMHLNYTSLMVSMFSLMSESPELNLPPLDRLKGAEPVSLIVWAGGKGTQWNFGLDFDVAAMARLMQLVTER